MTRQTIANSPMWQMARTLLTMILIPVASWSYSNYRSFIVLQEQYKTLKEQHDKSEADRAREKSELLIAIATEKGDRIADVSLIRNDFVEFRGEYYADFPVNYKKSLK